MIVKPAGIGIIVHIVWALILYGIARLTSEYGNDCWIVKINNELQIGSDSTWGELKYAAMEDDYQTQTWFVSSSFQSFNFHFSSSSLLQSRSWSMCAAKSKHVSTRTLARRCILSKSSTSVSPKTRIR